jgi:hypothetical protein
MWHTCFSYQTNRVIKYGSKVSWIVKWYGKYGRKASWIVKIYGKYGSKVSWIVKWYGKYGRKVSWLVKRYGKCHMSIRYYNNSSVLGIEPENKILHDWK